MLKSRPKRRSAIKIEEKETIDKKRKKTKSDDFEDDEEEEDYFSPMDNTDDDSDYNPVKEKEVSNSSEEEVEETESKFFSKNGFGFPKKPPWSKVKATPSSSRGQFSSFKSPAFKPRLLENSDSSSDSEFERVPDSLDDLGGFERIKKEVKKEDEESDLEMDKKDSKDTEYFDFSQIMQNQEVLKAAALKKEKDSKPGGTSAKRVKQRSSGHKKHKSNDDSLEVMELLALGEGAKMKHRDDDDDYSDEDSDEMMAQPKAKGIEVTIALPTHNKHKKKDKKVSDVEAALKRRFNLIKKENQVFAHKVHLLCWIAHGNALNNVLNSEDLMGVALSIIPSNYCYPPKRCDLTYLENFVKWFREKIKIDPILGKDAVRSKGIVTTQRLQEQFNKLMANSRLDQLLMFIATLRALGLLVRLIINLRPVPLKPPVKEMFTLSTKNSQESECNSKNNQSKKVEKEDEESKSTSKSNQSKKNVKEVEKDEDIDKSDEPVIKRASRRNVKNKDENNKGKSNTDDILEKKDSSTMEDKPGENSKKSKTRSKSSTNKSKSSKTNEVTDGSTNDVDVDTEENITRCSQRKSKTKENIIDDSKVQSNARSSRSNTKIVEKTSTTTPKRTKVPDNSSVGQKGKPDRTRSRPSVMKEETANSITQRKENNKSDRASRSKSATAEDVPGHDAKPKNSRSSSVRSKMTSKYFEDKQETSKTDIGVNGVENNKSTVGENENTGRGKRQKKTVVGNLKELVNSSDDEGSDMAVEKKKKKKKSANTEKPSKKISDSDEDFKGFDESRDDEMDKVELKKKKELNKSSNNNKKPKKTKYESDEDFEGFELESSYFKSKNKIDRRVLSSEDDESRKDDKGSKKSKNKNQTDEWAEVFLEAEEKWICVDLTKGMIHCVQQIYASASQPVTHVLGWENNKTIKDLTRRYVPHFMTVTRKQRVEDEWWGKALRPFAPPRNARNREEDEDLDRQMEDQPLPTSISEYKNHPLYALQRHLLKFQAIYPPDAPTLGFIRNEPVYSRACVAELHCRENWIKFAKVVKPGEEAYKVVKARPKFDKMTGEFRNDLPLPLFGPWQVDDYVPPPAKDGKVPRNEYGNVELFQPSMLPAGTVHLKLPGLNRVAKKLQIDCAQAVVGWDFHGGSSHVVMDGFVVCEEFKDTLYEAWHQEQQEAEKRAREKMEKKVYDNWKRLIKGLLIREKLKLKYGFEVEDEVAEGSSAGKNQKSKKAESSKNKPSKK